MLLSHARLFVELFAIEKLLDPDESGVVVATYVHEVKVHRLSKSDGNVW